MTRRIFHEPDFLLEFIHDLCLHLRTPPGPSCKSAKPDDSKKRQRKESGHHRIFLEFLDRTVSPCHGTSKYRIAGQKSVEIGRDRSSRLISPLRFLLQTFFYDTFQFRWYLMIPL